MTIIKFFCAVREFTLEGNTIKGWSGFYLRVMKARSTSQYVVKGTN